MASESQTIYNKIYGGNGGSGGAGGKEGGDGGTGEGPTLNHHINAAQFVMINFVGLGPTASLLGGFFCPVEDAGKGGSGAPNIPGQALSAQLLEELREDNKLVDHAQPREPPASPVRRGSDPIARKQFSPPTSVVRRQRPTDPPAHRRSDRAWRKKRLKQKAADTAWQHKLEGIAERDKVGARNSGGQKVLGISLQKITTSEKTRGCGAAYDFEFYG
ncbi:hypothetical protein MVEN_01973600 [Mycena venus]|uniref:Uncharacterized protein n=1 Tax=Mycena venus TaxID=2733690 RepID=A0A8H6XEG9_9AGAR|nr:hypothetical protein MVEN_01973600 [Mycena venus]